MHVCMIVLVSAFVSECLRVTARVWLCMHCVESVVEFVWFRVICFVCVFSFLVV